MGKKKVSGKDLLKIGYPQSKVMALALDVLDKHFKKEAKTTKLNILKKVLEAPENFVEDQQLGRVAAFLVEQKNEQKELELRQNLLNYQRFGEENIEFGAIRQMDVAARLPVSIGAALMPDAHQGYGLPIGGVLATDNAVIPYGVGVDIGCRMCLSIYNLDEQFYNRYQDNLKRHLLANTAFGAGGAMEKPMDDPIFEREEFKTIQIAKQLIGKAAKQIGSSGSGNHFVEWGLVDLNDPQNEFGMAPGRYLALLSHSGSRGLGAAIANHYTKVAIKTCKLPREAKHLAWLDLDSQEGQEYWQAMNLAGDYASACHHHIHRRMAGSLKLQPAAMVENHHNFAWKERMPDGREVIVHRKGATPAGKGVLGIIPGSMVLPGFVVRGKGLAASLNSASHGAGRLMSRTQAKQSFTQHQVKQLLQQHGVELTGGGLDEAPGAYKDIHQVMAAQTDLVEVIGKFTPKIVRMAD